jgi:hypothetical protein
MARKIKSHSQFRRVASRHKNEVLLHWLGTRGANWRNVRSKARIRWHLLQQANLIGIGFGAKETDGAFTGDLAVRIYVKRKLPKRQLSRRDRVPDFVNGILTDVIATGTPRFHARPVPFGSAISHARGETGSLGCIVTKAGDQSWFVLSACHVLAPAGAKSGDAIFEPSAREAGAAQMAVLIDFEALKTDGAVNRFDAAIAHLDRKTDILTRIPVIGSPTGPIMDPVLYQSVRKFGAGSLHTLGIVTDSAADVSFTMDGEPYLFNDIIQITGCGGRFSEGGDSGALVVDALTSRPVALIIGGAGERSYVSQLTLVMDRFGVKFLQ